MNKSVMVLAGAMLAVSSPALADQMPAQVLIDTCKQSTEESVAVCGAYFMGVLETIAMDGSTKFCVSGVAPMKLRDEFLAEAKAHAPAAGANAHEIVGKVLATSHACPK